MRKGWFDAPLHRYAIKANPTPIDGLALTHMDVTHSKICVAYKDQWQPMPGDPWDFEAREQLTSRLFEAEPETIESRGSVDYRNHWRMFEIESQLGVPIVVTSSGPTTADKKSMVL